MSKRQLIFGLILIGLGMIFLLRTMDILWISIGDLIKFLIPLGLIILGVSMIMRRHRQEQATPPPDPYAQPSNQSTSYGWDSKPKETVINPPSPPPPPPPSPGAGYADRSGSFQQPKSDYSHTNYSGNRVKYSNFFGDLNITCENIDMRNVEVSAFLGDIEVMLRQARLGPGLSRMVISGFIGDIRVLVPTGMAVFASGSNFIGDLNLFGRQSSGFGNSLDGQTQNYATSEQKLYIAINTFIGDVRVIEV